MLHELIDWSKKIKRGEETAQEQLFHQKNHPSIAEKYASLLFIGMGGSGIAGSLFKSILQKKSPQLPVTLVSPPHLPQQIPERSIAFLSSYSGNTWEVLDSYEQLKQRNIPLVVLTNGGKLSDIASQNNDLIIRVPACSAPRASLGSFVGILTVLCRQYNFLDQTFDLEEIIESIEHGIKQYNNAELYSSLIQNASRRTIVCIGVSNDSETASYRAQTQFNENSKAAVIHQNFPEFCHNGIVGITGKSQNCLVIFLHTSHLTAHEKQGLSALQAVLDDYQIPWYAVNVHEKKWELQLFELILWADFASFFLGKKGTVDITAVEAIDSLKKYYKNME